MEIGTGLPEPIEFRTHGDVRLRIEGTAPVIDLIDDTGKIVRFKAVRSDAGKQQLLVQFASGATQIISTEP